MKNALIGMIVCIVLVTCTKTNANGTAQNVITKPQDPIVFASVEEALMCFIDHGKELLRNNFIAQTMYDSFVGGSKGSMALYDNGEIAKYYLTFFRTNEYFVLFLLQKVDQYGKIADTVILKKQNDQRMLFSNGRIGNKYLDHIVVIVDDSTSYTEECIIDAKQAFIFNMNTGKIEDITEDIANEKIIIYNEN